jgi:hypothetical protein
MRKALVIIDGEAWRLLVVEGTETGKLTPLPGELDRLANDSGELNGLNGGEVD